MSRVQASRKRNMLRRIFGSLLSNPSPSATQSTLPTTSTSTSILSPPQQLASLDPGAKLLTEALSLLGKEEQITINTNVAHNVADVNLAIAQAFSAALGHKRACEDANWRWRFRGRDVVLREEADKVIHWLNRFKSVGDVAANVDPVHIGLPWVGIRILLEVVVTESRQMAALLIGMNIAMSTASRLQAYFDYFRQLPSTLVTENFEQSLIKMYVHVLRFIATAIQTYTTSFTTRVVKALWQTSSLEDFERGCDQLGQRAAIEASNCDRTINERHWEDAQQWRSDLKSKLDSMLKSINNVQGISDTLTHMHVKVDLTKLATVPEAIYNSYAGDEPSHCLTGTRTVLLNQIVAWADDVNEKCIFWLCGKAGTGKSTISRTIAHRLDQQRRLGASFFFMRNEGDRGNASRFFSTVTAQLADVIPGLSSLVAQALEKDSFLPYRGLQVQCEELLSQPLAKLMHTQTPLFQTFLVIDALDECDPESNVKLLISLLARLGAIASIRLRIFVTSRPELPIKLGFGNISGSLHQDMVLEGVQTTSIKQDLRIYFQHRLGEIRLEDFAKQPEDPLTQDWPSEEDLDTLAEQAVPLFIYAATVCRYIAESDPRERLRLVLQQNENVSLSGLEKTYTPILNGLITGSTSRRAAQIITELQELLGPIILVADPLSAPSLSRLLNIPLRAIRGRLSKLHSVIDIPEDCDAPIRILHQSFRDFLLDTDSKDPKPFWINEVETHKQLACKCLLLLSRPGILKKDLCGVEKPGWRRHETSQQVVAEFIAADTAYACKYWVWHLMKSGEMIEDDGSEHVFLKTHFLHWLEAMSWLEGLPRLISNICALQLLVAVEHGSQLRSFLDDAKRFVARNRHIADLAPLQIYLSALIFAPSASAFRRVFEETVPLEWLTQLPVVSSRWSSEIQILEGHLQEVHAVAFAPFGQMLASASSDKTVRLWDPITGEQTQKLEGHDEWVNGLAFNPTGQLLASSSVDGTIRLWHTGTGEELRRLIGHQNWVHTVAFSADGLILASGCADGTVKLWNVATGSEIWTLVGHGGAVRSVDFHPDGQSLASASEDSTVRVWSLMNGKETQKLLGHEDWVNAVRFSPAGQLLASASGDTTVRLWDTVTGDEVKKLQGHAGWINAVDFAPSGEVIASASHDNTVRLWSVATGEQIRKLDGHDQWVNGVAFSPSGEVVASVSGDRTIRLWDTFSDGTVQKLQGHDGPVLAVAIALDGRVLASASEDQNIILWDTTTGEAQQKLKGHDNAVWALAFSPDGQTLASASSDRTIMLWNTMTIRARGRITGLDDWVDALVFSPDGQVLVSVSQGKKVQLWCVADCHELRDFEMPQAIRDASSGNQSVFLKTAVQAVFEGLPVPIATDRVHQEHVLTLTEQWIQHQGEELVWLPHDFRGKCMASRGDLLAIGQSSGRVSFFRFDFR